MQTDWRFFMILACYSQFGVGCQAQNSPLQVKRPVMGWVFKQIKLYVTKIIQFISELSKKQWKYIYIIPLDFSPPCSARTMFTASFSGMLCKRQQMKLYISYLASTVIYFVPHTKSSVAYNCCTDCIVKNPTATIFTSLYSDCVEIMSLHQAMSINQTNKKRTNQYPDGKLPLYLKRTQIHENSMVRWPEEV